ncbi:hypothetical protein [Candidatus Laterigemmans baculatus]|uniref:hypothetical protein n=1 Tax=Candidatus Laterigemmans baculatus TaxID=2770505 RepID=UPI0013DA802D|nr:hypothetical protein [Candidatus Laterigemmans baculatus]
MPVTDCRISRLAAVFLLIACVAGGPVVAEELPQVEVSNIRRVFHNGEHNAFTDLIRFRDQLFLTFRSCPDGHMVHPTSSILVLSSKDGQDWKQVHRFSVAKRDTRDPHFLIFKDRLFVYTGTWYSGDTTLPRDQYDLNMHLGYAVHTEDGTDWTEPIMLEGTFGHYIWRAAAVDGKAYLCGRRKHQFVAGERGNRELIESAMLESDDGLVWRTHSLFQETQGDETAFQFDAEGNALAVARRGSAPAELLRSQPPYTQWQRKDLDRYVGGPLVAEWGDHTLVGGRKSLAGEGPKTALYFLRDDRLVEVAELPSGGDNSYPGFIAHSPTRGLVSWYSSHETDEAGKPITAIYLADLELTSGLHPILSAPE